MMLINRKIAIPEASLQGIIKTLQGFLEKTSNETWF